MSRCLLLAAIALIASAQEVLICTYPASQSCSGSPSCVQHATGYTNLQGTFTCPGPTFTVNSASNFVSVAGCYNVNNAPYSFTISCVGGADTSNPCFERETLATLSSGETILMSSLKSGDHVMDGPSSYSRVIVNQHRKAPELTSALMDVTHAEGSLSLTADHVLEIDGVMGPARNVRPGCKLGDSEVAHVGHSIGGIINPITASSKILADGVVAATHPEWIAQWMLTSYVPVPFSVSNLLSFVFPETTQAYYDALLEPFSQHAAARLTYAKGVLPDPLVAAGFLVADVATSAGFVVFSLLSCRVLAAVLVTAYLCKARKRGA